MKVKLEDGSMKTGEKTQMMTLASESWYYKKVSKYFNVSEYL